MIDMYYCFVYPYLQYCNEVWGCAYATHLNQLKLLQKLEIRVVAGEGRFDHTDILFSKFKILKFHQINDYTISHIMCKAFQNRLPLPCQSLFSKNDEIHEHNTRQKNNFHPPKPKSNLYKKTIAYKGVIVWKFVKKNIDIDCYFVGFKFKVKKMYLKLQ